jgi:catalase
MSYDDTQRYRIGPNFGQLPVNQARSPVFNNRQNGPMNFLQQQGPVNYYPSTFLSQASTPAHTLRTAGQRVLCDV